MRRTALVVLLTFFITATALAHPGSAIAVSPDGRVFFVDTGAGLYSIDRNKQLVRHDGPAFHWFALDATSRFLQTSFPSIPGGELRAVGNQPTIVLSSDLAVAVDAEALYFPQTQGDRARIVRVTPDGRHAVHAVLPNITRLGKTITWINGLAGGPNGSLYYSTDTAVRKIDRNGAVSLIAAIDRVPNCMVAPGTEVPMYLRGLAVAPDGTTYVAAAGCGALLKIDPRGVTTVLLRTKSPWAPTAVAWHDREVYVLEYLHTPGDDRSQWIPRVRKIDRNGRVVNLGTTR